MTFTIEQLEALKEGTTPGPWKVRRDKWGGGLDCPEIMDNEDNLRLAAAAPDLVDALIAEKQAHAKLRADIEALIKDCISSAETLEHNAMAAYSPEACESASAAERDTAEALTRILEENND